MKRPRRTELAGVVGVFKQDFFECGGGFQLRSAFLEQAAGVADECGRPKQFMDGSRPRNAGRSHDLRGAVGREGFGETYPVEWGAAHAVAARGKSFPLAFS